jgi:hypothetical protein
MNENLRDENLTENEQCIIKIDMKFIDEILKIEILEI